MDILRELLRRIRVSFNTKKSSTYKKYGIILLVLILFGILADIFLPFSADFLGIVSNFVRSFIAIPSAFLMFWIGYMISLEGHYLKTRTDSEWVPYRMRWSLSWRRSFSAICGAILLVFFFAVTQAAGYTFYASALLAAALALVVFIIPTREEVEMQAQGIQDYRDTPFKNAVAEREKKRSQKLDEKEAKRTRRTNKILGRQTEDL